MMIDLSFFRTEEVQHSVWIGVGGAMLVLLQSIFSGTRRAWYRLAASCFVGGIAAVFVGHMFSDSSWVYAYCGVAAIVAENVIMGIFNASEEFKKNPINVFAEIWRIVMPSFARGTDKPSNAGLPSSGDDAPAAG
jgi:hypothetical protein